VPTARYVPNSSGGSMETINDSGIIER
jgi:hypothetical protein